MYTVAIVPGNTIEITSESALPLDAVLIDPPLVISGSYAGTYTPTMGDIRGSVPFNLLGNALPSISGTTGLGDTLTGDRGLWLYEGVLPAWARTWESDNVDIAGASVADTFDITASEQGTDVTYLPQLGAGAEAESAPITIPPAPVASAPVLETFLASNGGGSTSSSVVLTKPSGVIAGDLLVLIAMCESGSATAEFSDNLAGWTFAFTGGDGNSDAHYGVFWRVATGSEGVSESVTIVNARFNGGFYLRISGAHATNPIDVSLGTIKGAAGADTTINEITTLVDDCLLIYGLSHDGGDGPPFSVAGAGWVQIAEYFTLQPGTSQSSGCFGTKTLAVAGLSADAVVTAQVADGTGSFQMSIQPA